MASISTPGSTPAPRVRLSPEALSNGRVGYSLLNQLLIWTTTALIFGALLERLTGPAWPARPDGPAREPVGTPS